MQNLISTEIGDNERNGLLFTTSLMLSVLTRETEIFDNIGSQVLIIFLVLVLTGQLSRPPHYAPYFHPPRKQKPRALTLLNNHQQKLIQISF